MMDTPRKIEVGDKVHIHQNNRDGIVRGVWKDRNSTQYKIRFVLSNGGMNEWWLDPQDFDVLEKKE